MLVSIKIIKLLVNLICELIIHIRLHVIPIF